MGANRLTLLLLVLGVSCATGCRGMAVSAVRANVDRQQRLLEQDPSHIDLPEVEAYLSSLGGQVLVAAHELDDVESIDGDGAIEVYDQFDVYLVHSVVPNAWTFGDDFAYVSTALVLEAESPEEVAAVVAHEFGHIREGHLIEERERRMRTDVLAGGLVVLGTACDLALLSQGIYLPSLSLADASTQAAAKLCAQYDPSNPADEYEADVYGLRVYRRMGLDSERYDDFLERMICLYGENGGPSHPQTTARLESITLAMESRADQPSALSLDPLEFQAMQSLIASELMARHEEGPLVTFEQHTATLRAQGFDIPHTCLCGPTGADPRAIDRHFMDALYRHLKQPTQGGDAPTGQGVERIGVRPSSVICVD